MYQRTVFAQLADPPRRPLTLVELLIVVSIAAALAGVAQPFFVPNIAPPDPAEQVEAAGA